MLSFDEDGLDRTSEFGPQHSTPVKGQPNDHINPRTISNFKSDAMVNQERFQNRQEFHDDFTSPNKQAQCSVHPDEDFSSKKYQCTHIARHFFPEEDADISQIPSTDFNQRMSRKDACSNCSCTSHCSKAPASVQRQSRSFLRGLYVNNHNKDDTKYNHCVTGGDHEHTSLCRAGGLAPTALSSHYQQSKASSPSYRSDMYCSNCGSTSLQNSLRHRASEGSLSALTSECFSPKQTKSSPYSVHRRVQDATGLRSGMKSPVSLVSSLSRSSGQKLRSHSLPRTRFSGVNLCNHSTELGGPTLSIADITKAPSIFLDNDIISKQREEIHLLMEELAGRDQELNDLTTSHQKQVRAWEADRDRLDGLQSRLSKYEEELNAKEEQLSQMLEEMGRVQEQKELDVAELGKTRADMVKLAERISENSSYIHEIEVQNRSLNASVKELLADKKLLEEKEQDINQQLEEKVSECLGQQANMKKMRETIEYLETQVELTEEKCKRRVQENEAWQRKFIMEKGEAEKLAADCDSKDLTMAKMTQQLQESLQQAVALQKALFTSCEREKCKEEVLHSLRKQHKRTMQELANIRELYDLQNQDLTKYHLSVKEPATTFKKSARPTVSGRENVQELTGSFKQAHHQNKTGDHTDSLSNSLSENRTEVDQLDSEQGILNVCQNQLSQRPVHIRSELKNCDSTGKPSSCTAGNQETALCPADTFSQKQVPSAVLSSTDRGAALRPEAVREQLRASSNKHGVDPCQGPADPHPQAKIQLYSHSKPQVGCRNQIQMQAHLTMGSDNSNYSTASANLNPSITFCEHSSPSDSKVDGLGRRSEPSEPSHNPRAREREFEAKEQYQHQRKQRCEPDGGCLASRSPSKRVMNREELMGKRKLIDPSPGKRSWRSSKTLSPVVSPEKRRDGASKSWNDKDLKGCHPTEINSCFSNASQAAQRRTTVEANSNLQQEYEQALERANKILGSGDPRDDEKVLARSEINLPLMDTRVPSLCESPRKAKRPRAIEDMEQRESIEDKSEVEEKGKTALLRQGSYVIKDKRSSKNLEDCFKKKPTCDQYKEKEIAAEDYSDTPKKKGTGNSCAQPDAENKMKHDGEHDRSDKARGARCSSPVPCPSTSDVSCLPSPTQFDDELTPADSDGMCRELTRPRQKTNAPTKSPTRTGSSRSKVNTPQPMSSTSTRGSNNKTPMAAAVESLEAPPGNQKNSTNFSRGPKSNSSDFQEQPEVRKTLPDKITETSCGEFASKSRELKDRLRQQQSDPRKANESRDREAGSLEDTGRLSRAERISPRRRRKHSAATVEEVVPLEQNVAPEGGCQRQSHTSLRGPAASSCEDERTGRISQDQCHEEQCEPRSNVSYEVTTKPIRREDTQFDDTTDCGNTRQRHRDDTRFENSPDHRRRKQREDERIDNFPDHGRKTASDTRFDDPSGRGITRVKDCRIFECSPDGIKHKQKEETQFEDPCELDNARPKQRAYRRLENSPDGAGLGHKQKEEQNFENSFERIRHKQRDDTRLEDTDSKRYNHREYTKFEETPDRVRHKQRELTYSETRFNNSSDHGSAQGKQKEETNFENPSDCMRHKRKEDAHFHNSSRKKLREETRYEDFSDCSTSRQESYPKHVRQKEDTSFENLSHHGSKIHKQREDIRFESPPYHDSIRRKDNRRIENSPEHTWLVQSEDIEFEDPFDHSSVSHKQSKGSRPQDLRNKQRKEIEFEDPSDHSSMSHKQSEDSRSQDLSSCLPAQFNSRDQQACISPKYRGSYSCKSQNVTKPANTSKNLNSYRTPGQYSSPNEQQEACFSSRHPQTGVASQHGPGLGLAGAMTNAVRTTRVSLSPNQSLGGSYCSANNPAFRQVPSVGMTSHCSSSLGASYNSRRFLPSGVGTYLSSRLSSWYRSSSSLNYALNNNNENNSGDELEASEARKSEGYPYSGVCELNTNNSSSSDCDLEFNMGNGADGFFVDREAFTDTENEVNNLNNSNNNVSTKSSDISLEQIVCICSSNMPVTSQTTPFETMKSSNNQAKELAETGMQVSKDDVQGQQGLLPRQISESAPSKPFASRGHPSLYRQLAQIHFSEKTRRYEWVVVPPHLAEAQKKTEVFKGRSDSCSNEQTLAGLKDTESSDIPSKRSLENSGENGIPTVMLDASPQESDSRLSIDDNCLLLSTITINDDNVFKMKEAVKEAKTSSELVPIMSSQSDSGQCSLSSSDEFPTQVYSKKRSGDSSSYKQAHNGQGSNKTRCAWCSSSMACECNVHVLPEKSGAFHSTISKLSFELNCQTHEKRADLYTSHTVCVTTSTCTSSSVPYSAFPTSDCITTPSACHTDHAHATDHMSGYNSSMFNTTPDADDVLDSFMGVEPSQQEDLRTRAPHKGAKPTGSLVQSMQPPAAVGFSNLDSVVRKLDFDDTTLDTSAVEMEKSAIEDSNMGTPAVSAEDVIVNVAPMVDIALKQMEEGRDLKQWHHHSMPAISKSNGSNKNHPIHLHIQHSRDQFVSENGSCRHDQENDSGDFKRKLQAGDSVVNAYRNHNSRDRLMRQGSERPQPKAAAENCKDLVWEKEGLVEDLAGQFDEKLSSFLEEPELMETTQKLLQGLPPPMSPASKLHHLLLESQHMIWALERSSAVPEELRSGVKHF